MRLASYRHGVKAGFGRVEGERIVAPTTRGDGRLMQRATLAQLIFPIPTIYQSTFTPLSRGDVIPHREARRRGGDRYHRHRHARESRRRR